MAVVLGVVHVLDADRLWRLLDTGLDVYCTQLAARVYFNPVEAKLPRRMAETVSVISLTAIDQMTHNTHIIPELVDERLRCMRF